MIAFPFKLFDCYDDTVLKTKTLCVLCTFPVVFAEGGHYSMRDVVFFLEHAILPGVGVGVYKEAAYKAGLKVSIHTADTNNLKLYLTGKIDDCEQIDRHVSVKRAAPVAAPRYAILSYLIL
jgi:hypothetical protein